MMYVSKISAHDVASDICQTLSPGSLAKATNMLVKFRCGSCSAVLKIAAGVPVFRCPQCAAKLKVPTDQLQQPAAHSAWLGPLELNPSPQKPQPARATEPTEPTRATLGLSMGPTTRAAEAAAEAAVQEEEATRGAKLQGREELERYLGFSRLNLSPQEPEPSSQQKVAEEEAAAAEAEIIMAHKAVAEAEAAVAELEEEAALAGAKAEEADIAKLKAQLAAMEELERHLESSYETLGLATSLAEVEREEAAEKEARVAREEEEREEPAMAWAEVEEAEVSREEVAEVWREKVEREPVAEAKASVAGAYTRPLFSST